MRKRRHSVISAAQTWIEWPPSQLRRQCFARNELLDKITQAVACLTRFIKRDQAGVMQLGRTLRSRMKRSISSRARQPAGAKEFQRHDAIEFGIASPEHSAERADAQLFEQLEFAEPSLGPLAAGPCSSAARLAAAIRSGGNGDSMARSSGAI